jgi:hypothetical protein
MPIVCFNPECRRDVKSKTISYCDEYLCKKCWKLVPHHMQNQYYYVKRERRREDKWIIKGGRPYLDETKLLASEALIWAKICIALRISPPFPAGLSTVFPTIFPREHLRVEEIVKNGF